MQMAQESPGEGRAVRGRAGWIWSVSESESWSWVGVGVGGVMGGRGDRVGWVLRSVGVGGAGMVGRGFFGLRVGGCG